MSPKSVSGSSESKRPFSMSRSSGNLALSSNNLSPSTGALSTTSTYSLQPRKTTSSPNSTNPFTKENLKNNLYFCKKELFIFQFNKYFS